MHSHLLPGARGAEALIQSMCGLIDSVGERPKQERLPDLDGASANTGRLSVLYPSEGGLRDSNWSDAVSSGYAIDADKATCNTRAVFEAVERYGSSVVLKSEVVTASQNELGEAALDLAEVPRCSEREYADPRCPLRPADPSRPIRWVRSIRLGTRQECFVPLVMSHLYIRPNRNENFWNQISTGVAAHTDLETAVVSAIEEVVERDAIALTWLAQIPLAEVLPDDGESLQLLASAHRSECRFRFFDATTDVGVPTLYGIQRRQHHPTMAQHVACATGDSGRKLFRKVMFELTQLNYAGMESRVPPESIDDFMDLSDGAIYMARPENAAAFDFISSRGETKRLSDFGAAPDREGKSRLAALRSQLARIGAEVYLVNLTTDDLRQAGVHVVRAIVPALMPFSPAYRARYLGHRRLYDYATTAGIRDFGEHSVNKYPQPFA